MAQDQHEARYHETKRRMLTRQGDKLLLPTNNYAHPAITWLHLPTTLLLPPAIFFLSPMTAKCK
jgi:hypothetical protein